MESSLGSYIYGDDITDTNNFRSQFSKKFENFDEGKLKDLEVNRIKVRRFQAIEEKVNDLLEAHEKLFFRKIWPIMALSSRKINAVCWGNGN